MAATLIETQDLLIDESARAGWASLEQSEQNDLLFWVNAPWSLRRRHARKSKAIVALQQGTESWDSRRPDVMGGLLDGIDALLPW